MKAIVVQQHGGPEQLKFQDNAARPAPGPKEALVKISASGVNFIDVYYRTGLYQADPPFTPGMEGAGVVEAVGEEVTDVRSGDHVAYAMARGSYAEYAAVPAWQLVPVPDGLEANQAAAAMLQGMTAHYLTRSTFQLQTGDTALIHAVAGGVGLLLAQMAKSAGARVIGTTSTEDKAEMAKNAGADEVILYTRQDFETEVKRLTGNRGVNVVYDGVGESTFMKSLNCLRPRGMMVSYGNASGPVPAIEPLLLNQKGSIFLTRPSLGHHCANRDELLWRAKDVLGGIAAGKLNLHIQKTYSLAEAAQAHRDLEGRKTTGKLILAVQ